MITNKHIHTHAHTHTHTHTHTLFSLHSYKWCRPHWWRHRNVLLLFQTRWTKLLIFLRCWGTKTWRNFYKTGMPLLSSEMHCVFAICGSPGLPYFKLQNHTHSTGTSTLPQPHLSCSLSDAPSHPSDTHKHTHTYIHTHTAVCINTPTSFLSHHSSS